MKKNIVAFWMIISWAGVQAQAPTPTLAEFTQQKKVQMKYLRKQIAGLQIYIGHVRKGYQLLEKGLHTISSIKAEDFTLHRDFFAGLKNVNPNIQHSTQVADIITYQIRIVQTYARSIRQLRTSTAFTEPEMETVGQVFSKLLDETTKQVDQLILLVRNDLYELTDDERIRRIASIHTGMQRTYRMIRQWSDDHLVLARLRNQESMDTKSLRQLYKIPQ